MEKLFTCEDIATRYGVAISTVWKWIREKKLIAIRIEKNYRVTESELLRFEKERTA